jgi:phage-related protein
MPVDDSPPKKIISVRFWCQANRNEPVREWLKSLSRDARRAIGEDIKTVEMGWPLGMPLVRSLGKGLWEVRTSFKDGIARVIFKMVDAEMILLHGFIKKSQKAPTHELEVALKRAKTLE